MEEFVLFVMTFLFVFIIYQFFVVSRVKKDKSKEPIEVLYLNRVYRLYVSNEYYTQLLQMIAITSSFDIALVVSIICYFESFWMKFFMGVFSTVIIILLSYHMIYLFYKKKGMVKDE